MPGLDLDVIDASGRRLGADEEGEIAVRLPALQMMLGYLHDEERTQAAIIEGPHGRWFLTGDRGKRDADGYFYYRGRRDDVINSSGYRIGPTEVENALLDHPAILECAVIGKPDQQRGEIVKAFVVLRGAQTLTETLVADIQEHVKNCTAPYKYPREIEAVAQLPKTLTGKIQRKALRDLEQSRMSEFQPQVS